MACKHTLAMLLLAIAPMAHAQPSTPPPPACASAEYRQFDFWLGEWEVTAANRPEQIIGRSTISSVSEGCALLERWRNTAEQEGRSLNVYEADRKQWTQFWVGADGIVLRLAGGLKDGAMVLDGELATAKGRQLQRIRWAPAADGSVSQHWQVSDDNGQSWTTSFLGIYRRKAVAPAAD